MKIPLLFLGVWRGQVVARDNAASGARKLKDAAPGAYSRPERLLFRWDRKISLFELSLS